MSVRLMVLGLLRTQAMHGYDMQKWLELSRADQWAGVLPGSIYHALRQMEKEKLIAIKATEQTGHRTRAIYSITSAGRAEFTQLLKKSWREPPCSFPKQFYALLTFGDALPAREKKKYLQGLIAELQHQLDAWREGEAYKKSVYESSPWVRAIFDNGRDHLQADLRMLQRLLDEL